MRMRTVVPKHVTVCFRFLVSAAALSEFVFFMLFVLRCSITQII